jgi:sterol 24-C-methyltransferase
MTPLFYGLITDFYEFGWGRSFHFAPRYKCETFKEAMTRYEHFFAANFRLDLTSNEKQCILDVGCGVGGPMRTIAKFFKYRVSITGVSQFC